MKPVRVLLSLLMVAAVLFASTSSVSAIGFDAEKAYESVFVVYSGTSIGSGFAIGENCVITNAHVITDTDNIAIVTYEGTEYAASLLGINEDEDIAVLVIENAAFSYLMMANLSAVKIGDDIYTIGAPKVEMSRNVQSGNTQNLKSSAAPVRLPAAPASTPGTSQAAAQAGCVYRP